MSQVKAGAAYVELTTRNSRFLRGLADAKRKLQDFGASARMLGRQILTNIVDSGFQRTKHSVKSCKDRCWNIEIGSLSLIPRYQSTGLILRS